MSAHDNATQVGEIVEMEDGFLVPVWRDGTPAAGTTLYAALDQAPAPAPTRAWNYTTAELSAIYGEMAAINETPAKHQTEAQRERLKVLRAEAVAIGVRRYALAAQANVRPKKAGG